MQKMQPDEVVKILAKHGTKVTEEQAKQILEFLRMLANIKVSKALRAQQALGENE